MACIYKITNKVNGKIYVGQTKNTLYKRWIQHKTEGKKVRHNMPLYRAMKYYGVENFEIECLQECEIEELNDLERYWIKVLDSRNNGYNATIGGQVDWNDEVQRHYLLTGKVNGERQKKRVCQYTLQGEYITTFDSIKEAADEVKTFATRISACCRHRDNVCAGYVWEYEGNTTTVDRIKSGELNHLGHQGKNVKQYTFEGEFIAEYFNCCEAYRKTGISNVAISNCLTGKNNTAGGYLWCYTGEEDTIKPYLSRKGIKRHVIAIIDGVETEYESCCDVERKLGIPHETIQRYCTGKIAYNKKGYKFRYK